MPPIQFHPTYQPFSFSYLNKNKITVESKRGEQEGEGTYLSLSPLAKLSQFFCVLYNKSKRKEERGGDERVDGRVGGRRLERR
jgi:hypothetical protein